MVAQDTEETWISIPGGRNLLFKELAFVLSFTVPTMVQDTFTRYNNQASAQSVPLFLG